MAEKHLTLFGYLGVYGAMLVRPSVPAAPTRASLMPVNATRDDEV